MKRQITLTALLIAALAGRHIPITDKEAFVSYYAVCLKRNYGQLHAFFEAL